MFYEFLYPLKSFFFGFNLFRYITFRSAYAVVTALVLTWIFTPLIINLAKKKNIGENIRSDGPERHKSKSGTPTMGGLIVLLSILVTVFLWSKWDNKYVWLVTASIAGFGLLGFLDDWLKLKRKKGLVMIVKLIGQFAIAGAIVWFIWSDPEMNRHSNDLYLPFFNDPVLKLGWLFIPLSMLVIVFSSNMVNLTDGLDGLAIGLTMVATLAFVVLIYASSNYKLASYLRIPFVPGTGELTVVAAAVIGASLGFLWYNSHPAQIFMGDTGALSLGGVLGVMAVLLRKEVMLFIIGGVFVAEAVSVILQVGSFKLFKKRVFLMAPLHHHLELKGWAESKVVIRLWIIGAILALIGVSTLKIK
jgi:phospho-N-acetylmuramoyl-pentapeptide-transferase